MPVQVMRRSAGVAARRMKLAEHAMDEAGSGSWRLGVLVVEIERLPLEGAELMEGLHLHPLDISHGSDEPCDAIDIGQVVRVPRHQGKPHPDALAHGSEPFRETQGRSQLAAG